MASMDPGEDEISQVIDFAGLNPVDDRTLVINALKNNNRNCETVVMQFFDNPVDFRQKYSSLWDDSMFSAERDGSANNTGITFHIESMTGNDIIQSATPPPPGYAAGAPSRPPSRSNDRSPLGRMVDWTASDADAGPLQVQEDDDMQRALRVSAQEAGVPLPAQESGITNASTSTPHFGPANRTDYDQGNWAMVPVGPSETKLPKTPLPSKRRKVQGAPAFLISGSSSAGVNCLGGLLTILHEIPLARNTLLNCGSPAASYGFNSEWWNGQEILSPEVLAQLQTGELRWGDDAETKPNFDEEIHRLMAFLDSTERSYGTISVLADLTPYASSGVEKQFYEHLGERNGEKLEPLYQVATLASVHGNDLGGEEAKFGLLELEHLRTDYINIKTLYESLDHLMWNDVLSWNEVHEGSKMAMFQEMGEVVAIKIGNDGPLDSIEIPEELYPEKYLFTRKEEARQIQLAWCETKNALAKVATEEQSLQEWQTDWNQQAFNKKEMLQRVKEQWETFDEYLQTCGKFQAMQAAGFDTDKYPDYRAAPCEMTEEQQTHSEEVNEVVNLAERIMKDIEFRTQDLRSQLSLIQARQRFLGRLLTKPNKQGRPKPMICNKFLLRGVATDSDIIYVCQRLEPDLIEFDEETKPLDQWWRLQYSPNEEQLVKSEKIEIERVLRDMWQDTKTPLLIYATEEALKAPKQRLSNALSLFGRSDNRAFRQELRQESSNAMDETTRGPMDSISPSKRKHRDSMDSINSNCASIGSDDRNEFDNPFDDNMESIGTELADLAGSVSDNARSADVEENTGEDVLPPQYPDRDSRLVGVDSATLTPDTLAAEENEVSRVTSLDNQNKEQEIIDLTTPKTPAPEMQERARPLTFAGIPQQENGKQKQDMNMDMEIPDHQE